MVRNHCQEQILRVREVLVSVNDGINYIFVLGAEGILTWLVTATSSIFAGRLGFYDEPHRRIYTNDERHQRFIYDDGLSSQMYNIMCDPGFRIARSTLQLMLLHISSRYCWNVINSSGSTLHCCLVSCTGSNEDTGCSLHVTSRFPTEPENPWGPIVAPLSAWNRWRMDSSLLWSRHTSHCRGCPKPSSSHWIMPAVCPVLKFVPSHSTTSTCSLSSHSALSN